MDQLVLLVSVMITQGNYKGLMVVLGLFVLFIFLCLAFKWVLLYLARAACRVFLVHNSGYFLELGLIHGVSSPLVYGRYRSLIQNLDTVGVLETLARYSTLKNSIQRGRVNYDY